MKSIEVQGKNKWIFERTLLKAAENVTHSLPCCWQITYITAKWQMWSQTSYI